MHTHAGGDAVRIRGRNRILYRLPFFAASSIFIGPRAHVSLSAAPARLVSPAAAALLKLKTGDDVRGIVNPAAQNALLPESAYWIGVAFREWLGSSTDLIAVGSDPRSSSDAIATAFCQGARAEDVGLATTPAMLESLLQPTTPFVGAVMVTASHLPREWNGLKLFARPLGRGLNKKEVKQVMALAVERATSGSATIPSRAAVVGAHVAAAGAPARLPSPSFMAPYAEKLRETVRKAAIGSDNARGGDRGGMDATLITYPLLGMRICVNPGNGAGGFFATEVLEPLGADISSSIHLAPDGLFPAHLPNPESAEHVDATCLAVASSGAEVGVMLDTDVDRCGLFDGCRSPPEPVHKNRLIALCATEALEAAGHSGVIVTDPVTSAGMGTFIRAHGGEHDRFKMGYRNVIDRAAQTQPAPALLAIETSGHSAWRDNDFVDDGCYTAARLLGRLARERRTRGEPRLGLLDLLGDSLQEPLESIKVKMAVRGGLPAVGAAEAALCAALRRCADGTHMWAMEAVNHDGLRCAVGHTGWLIIRGSLHEPSVSVQTESDVAGGTADICTRLLEYALADGECYAAGIDLQPLWAAGPGRRGAGSMR